MRAALGFRDHSGWAVAVAVSLAGDGTPVLLAKERIVICPAQLPRQPYHAVAEQGMPRSTIAGVERAALDMAASELTRILATLAAGSHEVTAAGIGESAAAISNSLDAILRTHTLLHAAEGRLFREALAEASAACSLRVHRFLQREVFGLAAGSLHIDPSALDALLGELGKSAGRPWQKDHREAAAAAIIALAL